MLTMEGPEGPGLLMAPPDPPLRERERIRSGGSKLVPMLEARVDPMAGAAWCGTIRDSKFIDVSLIGTWDRGGILSFHYLSLTVRNTTIYFI
jgi:hypothetical protein